ncbi:MAG: hypothetical protein WC802_00670 [Patescibacteria group bacterium]|jgi:predicted P-loop ATPase/GTPase
MKYRGLLLKEGLTDETILNDLVITKTDYWDVKNSSADQPKQWTAVSFEVEGDRADVIAENLSNVLKPTGWYLNMNSNDTVMVVFPGKVFKYLKGDSAKRAEAIEFGRSIEIPDSQLDWEE